MFPCTLRKLHSWTQGKKSWWLLKMSTEDRIKTGQSREESALRLWIFDLVSEASLNVQRSMLEEHTDSISNCMEHECWHSHTEPWTIFGWLQRTDIKDKINEFQQNVNGQACENVSQRFNTVRNPPVISKHNVRPDEVSTLTWFEIIRVLFGSWNSYLKRLKLEMIL